MMLLREDKSALLQDWMQHARSYILAEFEIDIIRLLRGCSNCELVGFRRLVHPYLYPNAPSIH
jgi:hypothetical protein